MRQGEHFCRVSERYRALAWAVESAKKEDKESNRTQVSPRILRDIEAESCGKQSPRHLWEGEEKKVPSSVRVDGPHGGKGEYEVHESKAERSQESFCHICTSFSEDSGRVESDDVDTTHLLRDHDGEGGKSGPPDARDGEQLNKSRCVSSAPHKLLLHFDLCMDVVEITSSLQLGVPQTAQRLVCFAHHSFLDIPPWRFRAKVDPNKERQCRDKSRAKL